MSDTERMDFLERYFSEHAENGYYKIILRGSSTGRGARLHHVRDDTWGTLSATVRQAVDLVMAEHLSKDADNE